MLCNQHKLCHQRRTGVSSNVQPLPPASVVYSPASTAAHHCSTSACGGKGAFAQPVKATPLSQLSAHRASASRVITTRATGSSADVTVPAELPLFPVMPIGVFVPGMTKTLHLYEAHFNALMEEVLASPQRLMCTAVLEPFMGPPQPSNTSSQWQEQQAATQPPLGSEPAVEGNSDNTPGTMSQALRWMAAQQSQGISAGQGVAVEGLGAAAGRFNAGSSSSSGTGVGSESDPDESAWMPLGSYVGGANYILSCGCLVKVLDAKPYVGGYLVRIRGEARLGISGLVQMEPYMRAQVYPIADHAMSTSAWQPGSPASRSLSELDDVMRDVQNLAAKFRCDETAAIQQAMRWVYAAHLTPMVAALPTGAAELSSGQDTSSSMPSASTSATADDGEDVESAENALQRAARLSFAALQWLPQSSTLERTQVLRARLLAMETRDVEHRLGIALEAMGPARSSLAAKCAIATM